MYKLLALVFFFQSITLAQSWVAINGLDNTIHALATVNDKMYAGGDFNSTGGYSVSPHISYYSGRTWQTLGSGLDSTVYCIIGFDSDVVAGGEKLLGSSGPGPYVVKWNGVAWSAMGGVLNGPVYCMAVYNGNLYAGGAFAGAGKLSGIAMWDGDANWLPVGNGVDNPVYALAVYNGELYAAGEFSQCGDIAANFIAKWNDTTWSILGTLETNGVDSPVSALCVFNGSLYVGGIFSHAGGESTKNIARWDGTNWYPVGDGVNGLVSVLTVSNDLLYIGGTFTKAGNLYVNKIAGWNGTSMSQLGLGMEGTEVKSLLGYNGDLYAGGSFTKAGGISANNFARWSASADVSTLSVAKYWDRDGLLTTSADQTPKQWNMSLYKDSVSASTLVASGNTTSLTIYLSAPGTYIACEADSEKWSRLNGNASLYDTIQVPLNTTVLDPFINFHQNSTMSVSIDGGWNMLSNPLNETIQDADSLFRRASSQAFSYDRGSGYYVVSQLVNGLGFWLKYNSNSVETISGFAVDTISIPVKAGWNMIGSITKPVLISSIIQIPVNIVSTPYYQYKNGYQNVDTLLPAKAYWVKMNKNGTLFLQSSGSLKGSTARTNPFEDMGCVKFTDAGGNSGVLFVGDDRNNDCPISQTEMPPLPPRGAFDVRFRSQRAAEIISRSSLEEPGQVQLSSEKYPLRVEWTFPQSMEHAYLLYDAHSGRTIALLAGSGHAMLTSAISDLRIKMTDAVALPKKFALHQNYPNPFNPATTFAFDLPEKSDVSLAIYDQLGRIVASLLNHEQIEAGAHTISWDGSQAASGVYYYRLAAVSAGTGTKNFLDVKKMVLIK